ncbi:DUF6624 domain-containing protein [Flavobacterium sp.]|uniref:DUF6624 domain-containing protein n=1 Tax=Flavobacterium sp. TaxID=239 RepID=UPI0037511181
MKKSILLILILFNTSLLSAQECNYIDNYYPLIFKAQIFYLEGKNELAYTSIKEAEKFCPLLNQSSIYEIDILAQVAIALDKKEEALNCIELLVKNYGYKFSYFEEDPIYTTLKENTKWKILKATSDSIYQDYLKTINFDLKNELSIMTSEDQRVRQQPINFDEMLKVDTKNENRLKEIIAQYGYPNEKLIGAFNFEINKADISTMIFHLKDVAYWKPIFLNLIKKGEAPFNIYANLVDSNQRTIGMFIYKIYDNISSDKIIDVDNLDNRRVSVGLRTVEMQHRMMELKKIKYGF